MQPDHGISVSGLGVGAALLGGSRAPGRPSRWLGLAWGISVFLFLIRIMGQRHLLTFIRVKRDGPGNPPGPRPAVHGTLSTFPTGDGPVLACAPGTEQVCVGLLQAFLQELPPHEAPTSPPALRRSPGTGRLLLVLEKPPRRHTWTLRRAYGEACVGAEL